MSVNIKIPVRPLFLLATLSLLVSCTAEKRLHRRLTGTWNIDRYEQRYPQGEPDVSTNLGSVTFRKNGSGDNDMPILTRNLRKPEARDFSWKNTTDEVTIVSHNSYLAKTWLVVKNKRKYQLWKSTTQANVQTMELRKQ